MLSRDARIGNDHIRGGIAAEDYFLRVEKVQLLARALAGQDADFNDGADAAA
jgi:hypothetical protein